MAKTSSRTSKRCPTSVLPGLDLPAPSQALAWPHCGPTVAGVDEVGRGCLAGPVVACAVILPKDYDLPGLNDSKKLTAKQRDDLAPRIREQALAWGLGVVPAPRIDLINILQATFLAMAKALRALETSLPPHILVDGNKTIPEEVLARVLGDGHAKPILPEQRFVVGGDASVAAIAAASIVAKTWRDACMVRLDSLFPGYGFAVHKGYGTKAHLEALRNLGPCPLHRRSFKGVVPETAGRASVLQQTGLLSHPLLAHEQ